MGDFKVGDKVRVLKDGAESAAVTEGQVLTVVALLGDASIQAEAAPGEMWWLSSRAGDSVELVEPEPEWGFKAGDRVRALETSIGNRITKGESYEVTRVEDGLLWFEDGRGVLASRFERIEQSEPEWDIKPGDRYRYTVEGIFTSGDERDDSWYGLNAGTYGPERDWELETLTDDVITIEKIEEPFKPGDFVREVATDRVFYVATNGYVQVTPGPGQFNKFGPSGIEGALPHDTGGYERVEYARVPF